MTHSKYRRIKRPFTGFRSALGMHPYASNFRMKWVGRGRRSKPVVNSARWRVLWFGRIRE